MIGYSCRRCRQTPSTLQDHQLRQGRKPQGRQAVLLSLPHRRVQRRPHRRQRQRQAGDRPDHAPSGTAHDANRAHGREGPRDQIDGGADARILRDYLHVYGDDNTYMCPAEASVGVNAKAVVRGIQREDKNIMGTMHFGLGTNIDVGGSVKSKIHMDGVILEPTLYVDGVKRSTMAASWSPSRADEPVKNRRSTQRPRRALRENTGIGDRDWR